MPYSDLKEALSASYHLTYRRINQPFDARRFQAEHKHLLQYLPAGDLRILDLGCGEGRLLSFLRQENYHRLVGVDLAPGQLQEARRNLGDGAELIQISVLDYPDGDVGLFDVVFLFDLIEHLTLEEAFLLLQRVRDRLVPGGRVFIRTPNMGTFGAPYSRYHDLTHQIGFTDISLQELLEIVGFPHCTFIPTGPQGAYGNFKRCLSLWCHRVVYWLADRNPPRQVGKNLLVTATKESGTSAP